MLRTKVKQVKLNINIGFQNLHMLCTNMLWAYEIYTKLKIKKVR